METKIKGINITYIIIFIILLCSFLFGFVEKQKRKNIEKVLFNSQKEYSKELKKKEVFYKKNITFYNDSITKYKKKITILEKENTKITKKLNNIKDEYKKVNPYVDSLDVILLDSILTNYGNKN